MSTSPHERALSDVSTEDLRRLIDALDQGRIEAPLDASMLGAYGFHEVTPHCELLFGLDRMGVRAVLLTAIAERAHHGRVALDLVWTGPDTKVSEARYTPVVVRELFEKARHHVIIGGYSFDHGDQLFEPLHRVMRDQGVTAEIFVDIGQMDSSLRRWARSARRDMRERLKLIRLAKESSADDYAQAVIAWFLDAQWPFGDPKPLIHYDARTADPKSYASLHAKCVIVDNRYTLITSANFTDRGHSRNIEAGVVIDDEAFATRLATQWSSVRR